MQGSGEQKDSISINLRGLVVGSTGWVLPLLIQPPTTGLSFTYS